MRFWCAVSAIAGALRRKVWIDQAYFKWYPNFYIVLVAKPGIVSKSTTADVAMRLLRAVPGIKFGPDVVTWPALVSKFADSAEGFEYPPKTWNVMSAMTLESGEFGNLLDPQDRAMVDLYVTLWDGKQGAFTKETKTSGNDEIQNPWINLVACTTPAWIAGSFPEYMIGGGFTSRCIFVYADAKQQEVAYPKLRVPKNQNQLRETLVKDLEQISTLVGEYELTPAAYAWGEEWYHRHNAAPPPHLNDDRFGGYLARKQTHIHKLAMVLSASRGDSLWIDAEHLATAEQMVSDLEPDMAKVFARIGRSDESLNTERMLSFIRQVSPIEFSALYRNSHTHWPRLKNFEDIIAGLAKAKLIGLSQGEDGKMYVRSLNG